MATAQVEAWSSLPVPQWLRRPLGLQPRRDTCPQSFLYNAVRATLLHLESDRGCPSPLPHSNHPMTLVANNRAF